MYPKYQEYEGMKMKFTKTLSLAVIVLFISTMAQNALGYNSGLDTVQDTLTGPPKVQKLVRKLELDLEQLLVA